MGKKTFKSLDEQIKILKEKGLVINDEDKTKEILFRENYFFINGYRHLFQRENIDNKFIAGTTFEELYGTFIFDRNIRNIMFKYILIIENNVKSIIGYQMSRKYGFKEKEYLNPKNFNQDNIKIRQVYDVLNKVKRQLRVNGKQHAATSHYMNNYAYIPMWVLVKVLSFGIISELYGILRIEDQISIASYYGLNTSTLMTYLQILSNFRNLCAHEDILYDHKAQRSIDNTIYHGKLDIPKLNSEYIYGKDDLFAIIIILKQLLRMDDFFLMMSELEYEIHVLADELNTISIYKVLDRMGFPSNYAEIVRL